MVPFNHKSALTVGAAEKADTVRKKTCKTDVGNVLHNIQSGDICVEGLFPNPLN